VFTVPLMMLTYIFTFIISKIREQCNIKAASFPLAAFVYFVTLNQKEQIKQISQIEMVLQEFCEEYS
ncbi:MAG: hypothetical protein ACI4PV_05240, partial [Butyricicoccus sp.]